MTADAHDTCEENIATQGTALPACYQFAGGWVTDFETLADCHSVVGGNCATTDKPIHMGTFEWSVSPTYVNLKTK